MDIAITLITSSPGSAGWCLGNSEIMTRQSLWGPVTRQSLVTRKMAIFASNAPLVNLHRDW